jgi:hypothetical protein
MTKQELIETAKTMIAAPSCCQDLKTVAQTWIDAVGTAGEKAAADALLAELKEDVCTIDDVIPFFESPRAVQYFGEEKAKELAALAHKVKADGGKWCFCDACAAGAKLMENAEAFAC